MKRLPDSELELMMIIWDLDRPVNRMEIEEQMDQSRDILPNTVLSFLSRLEEKGFVKKEKQGKLNVYTPLIKKEPYLKKYSKNILEKLFDNSVSKFVTTLYDGGSIDKEQLEELKDYLNNMEE